MPPIRLLMPLAAPKLILGFRGERCSAEQYSVPAQLRKSEPRSRRSAKNSRNGGRAVWFLLMFVRGSFEGNDGERAESKNCASDGVNLG